MFLSEGGGFGVALLYFNSLNPCWRGNGVRFRSARRKTNAAALNTAAAVQAQLAPLKELFQ